MAWTWTSNFPVSQGIFVPEDDGFGDAALYTLGVGWESVDIQTGGSFSRITDIETENYNASFNPTEVNTITVNYDYIKGAAVSGASTALRIIAVSDGGADPSLSVIFNDMVDGAGQTKVLNANILDCTAVTVWIRSSAQNSASYSGSLMLNSIVIEGGAGGGINPFDNDASFITPTKYIEDEGGAAAGGAGGGAGGNIASISADGLYIYIASFNTLGYPILIKILSALNADGSRVFEPGAGGRIGVKTAEFEADTVFVAGQFDSTNTVEKSDDAGATFSAIDDGTFGTIRTFQIGPGDDNRILLFDGDNGDIIESLDGGETWTTINASVTQLVNSIARFDVSPEESVFGNQGDVTDSINYSPNSGANLEDYQTGVYPNADATKVLSN